MSEPYARELEVAIDAARQAGTIVLGYYEGEFEVREKSHDNPVTAADLEADECIKRILLGAFPNDGWLSEETADSGDRLERSRAWVVDPLDGTKEFTQHIPEFCICIALVEHGKPVVGVSFNPAADRMYAASRGRGTTCNGEPVRASTQSTLRDAEVLASRSEDKRGEWDPFKDRVRVLLTGSVAFKLAELSRGEGDATFTLTPKNEWDICSGTILLEEAGGTATGLDGKPLVFNQPSPLRDGMIATNGVLHDAIVAMIDEVGYRPPKRERR